MRLPFGRRLLAGRRRRRLSLPSPTTAARRSNPGRSPAAQSPVRSSEDRTARISIGTKEDEERGENSEKNDKGGGGERGSEGGGVEEEDKL